MNYRNNRGAQRTKAALQRSFFELATTKPLRRITVNELAEKSGVSRGTFYTHYHDVFELAESIGNELIAQLDAILSQALATCEDPLRFPMARDALEFIVQHRIEVRIFLVDCIEPGFIDKADKLIRRHVITALSKNLGSFKQNAGHLAESYIASGVIGLICSWVAHGCEADIDEMTHLMGLLITRGASGLIDE